MASIALLMGAMIAACGSTDAATQGATASDRPIADADPGGSSAPDEEGSDAATEDAAPTDMVYAVGVPAISVFNAPYASIAQELGYYAAEGLNVQVEAAGGATSALQLILAGQADVTCCGVSSGYALAAQDDRVRMISFYQDNIYGIFVPEDSDIESVEELAGLDIGAQTLGSSSYLFGRAIVAEGGLDPDGDVTFVPIGVGAQAATALAAGDVDAYASFSGAVGIVETTLGTALRRLPTALDALPATSSFMTSTDFLDAEPAAVRGFMRAIYKSYVFAVTNPVAAVQVHWERYPEQRPADASLAVAEQLAAAALPLWRAKLSPENLTEFGELDEAVIQATADFMLDHGIIEQALTVSDFIDLGYLDGVSSVDVPAVQAEARSWVP